MKNVILYVIFILIFLRCEAPIVFTEAQPRDVKESIQFENPYQGTFMCTEDSALVRVEPQVIYKEKPFQFGVSPAELDTLEDVKWLGDKIYIIPLDEYVDVENLGDTLIVGELWLRDTLFAVGQEQVLKYYRGHQILNKKLSGNRWEVTILSLDEEGNLTLSKTVIPEDLGKLEAITPVKNISREDHTQYLLSPTRAEFRKLLEAKLIFEACDTYERIDGGI